MVDVEVAVGEEVEVRVELDIGSAGMLIRKELSQQSLPFALQHQYPIPTLGQGRTKYPAEAAARGDHTLASALALH